MTQLKEETQAEERQGLLDREVEEVEEEEDAKGPVEEEEEAVEEEPAVDSRFHQPTPSPFKRILLLLFIGFLFWFAFVLGRARVLRNKKPQIIYANRYSAEHKFRPAASPIITETLKDGRLRIRGAGPTASATPTSTPTKVQKRKTGKKKLGKKSKRAKKFKGASK